MVRENKVLLLNFSKKKFNIYIWSQSIQAFAIKFCNFGKLLDKKLKTFWTLTLLFSKILSSLIFYSAVAFQQYQIFSKYLKSYGGWENQCNE